MDKLSGEVAALKGGSGSPHKPGKRAGSGGGGGGGTRGAERPLGGGGGLGDGRRRRKRGWLGSATGAEHAESTAAGSGSAATGAVLGVLYDSGAESRLLAEVWARWPRKVGGADELR